MSRKVADCRDFPSETGCTLTISGEEDEVVAAAVQHAVSVHGHQDNDEGRRGLRDTLKDGVRAPAGGRGQRSPRLSSRPLTPLRWGRASTSVHLISERRCTMVNSSVLRVVCGQVDRSLGRDRDRDRSDRGSNSARHAHNPAEYTRYVAIRPLSVHETTFTKRH